MNVPYNCLSFNGIDDYVDCGKFDLKTLLPEEFTIEVWLKISSENNQTMNTIFGAIITFPNGFKTIITSVFDPVNGCVSLDDLIEPYNFSTSHKAVNDGKWHHCAAVIKKNPNETDKNILWYIDGVFDSSGIWKARLYEGICDFTIGKSYAGSGSWIFKGQIAELRFWNKALSLEEINAVKNQRLQGTEAGLVAYWSFNSGDFNQTILKEKTGKADATIHGAAWQHDDGLALAEPNASEPAPLLPPPSQAAVAACEDLSQPEVIATSIPIPPPPPQPIVNADEKPLATDTKNESAPPLTPDIYAPLLPGLPDGDWRKQVIEDARKATINGSLQVKDDTFSGFNVFETVTGTLFKVINIQDVKVELANSLTGEKVEEDDPSGSKSPTVGNGQTPRPTPLGKRFRFKAEGGVRISGTVHLLGLKSAEVSMEFTMSDEKEKSAVIKIKAGDGEGNEISEILGGTLPEGVKDVISVLDKAQLFNPAFAFSTSNVVDTEDPFDVGIGAGFNFYGKLSLSDFKSDPNGLQQQGKDKNGLAEMLGFVADVFKLEEITARLCIKKQDLGGLAFELDTVIETDLEFSAGENLKIVFHGAVISLALGGSPPEPRISIATSVGLTVGYIGANKLAMSGMISLEPESISPSFTLQAMEEPWHPFDFSGLSVRAMSVEMGGTYVKPWIDNFGFAAEDVQIGSVTGSIAFKLDSNDYDNFAFQVKIVSITFIEIASTFSRPVFIAYQALPDSVTEPLETLINCQVKNAEVSIVPVSTTIGQLVFDKEGITARGEMHLWGWVAKMDTRISVNEVDVSAEMEPIHLSIGNVELLKIKGVENDEKPKFSLYLGTDKDPSFLMSVAVTILSVRSEVRAEANKDVLKFKLENSLGFCSFLLTSSLDSSKFYGEGSIDFSIDQIIPTGILGDINLNAAANFSMVLQIDHKFYLDLSGYLAFAGHYAGISFQITEPLPDFEALLNKLLEYLKDNAIQVFLQIYQTLEEWAYAVKEGAIAFGGSVANVAKNVYEVGADAVSLVIDAAKIIGETPEQIAKGIKEIYSFGEEQVAKALKLANYTAEQVANAINAAFELTLEQIVQIMQHIDYAADEVAKAVSLVFDAGGDAVAIVLKGAGYAIEEITDALDYGLDLSETAISKALEGAGYAIDTLEDVLKPLNPANWVSPAFSSVLSAITTWPKAFSFW